MSIHLQGLALQNYRGIGARRQAMAPFKRFNFFIGANNSGKSTVLNFISNYLPIPHRDPYSRPAEIQIEQLEKYAGGVNGQIVFEIGISLENFVKNSVHLLDGEVKNKVSALVKPIAEYLQENGFIWLKNELPYKEHEFRKQISPKECTNILSFDDWKQIWLLQTSQRGGGLEQHWFPETMKRLLDRQTPYIPQTILIPAIRQIGPSGAESFDYSGVGLIDRLAQIQSPDHDKREDRDIFDTINHFLQTVTDRPEAQIEIPHNRVHVLVHIHNRVLPLTSLGTGIHEVIMLAAACTLNSNKIICIEEPEIHLHPILQRKLIRYLAQYTNNQYFIATHSSAFIDTPGAAVFHVTNDGTQTYIRESLLRSDRYAICADLGHRASDIMQSNAVIWVEGPSERIYLQHWIKAYNPDFVEGVHYSIMFYGGRLLSHLSADDREVQAFIDLRSLNQNLAVIMDSDKEEEGGTINGTKMRIASEFKGGRGISWITAGREIENYVDFDLLQEGLAEIHSEIYDKPDKGGQYDHAFYFRMKQKTAQAGGPPSFIYKKADKVKLAKWVCRRPANLEILDLKGRIIEVGRMIEAANR